MRLQISCTHHGGARGSIEGLSALKEISISCISEEWTAGGRGGGGGGGRGGGGIGREEEEEGG